MHNSLPHILLPQEIEAVKAEMRALRALEGRMPAEAFKNASEQLLNKLYRATGPAKLGAAIQHVISLLEQGAQSQLCTSLVVP